MEIALKLHSMEDDYYDDNDYDNNDYDDDDYDTTSIDKILEECERDLQLLWDTFLSLTTNHTFVGRQLVRITTPPPTIQTGWTYISWGGPLYIYG